MSDHDPSYYEIALTNRQVMVAFVILLSCLLGTFFAGVWVGRSEAETGEATSVERRAENDTGVEELDFFSGGDLGESDQEPAPPVALPDPAAARAEREARRPAEGPVAEPPPAAPSRPAETRPDPRPGDDDLAGGEGPALDEAAPAAAEPAPARPTGGGPVIQVFSSRDREQAERVIERLRNGGERPSLSPVEVGGQTMYRVRLGPFADRAEADRVAERVRRGFGLETWITQ